MTVDQKISTPFDLAEEELESMDSFMDSIDDTKQEYFSRGAQIEATIVDVYDNDVYLDIGSKQNGRCPLSEFSETPRKNDLVQVVVLDRSGDGMVELSKKEADRRSAWKNLKSAYEAKAQLSGTVIREVKLGYILDADGIEVFLPLSQSGERSRQVGKLSSGQNIDFKILDIKERFHSAVVSHLALILERNDAQWKELIEKHKVGDVVEGSVSKKVSFGVFVNVQGIEGLLHQSDISWKKNAPFKDRFKLNEPIQVKILSMDKDNNRLSLGIKQMAEDPWAWAQRELSIGSVVHGSVTSITDYGAFVEIRDGIEGLVHVSELTWAKRVKHPKKYLLIGQEVDAQVLTIDIENRRIGLGLRQLAQDPWSLIGSEISVGDIMEGEITSVTKFGAFVKIRDDIEGLIHFNDYSWDDRVDHKMLKKGDRVNYKILDINVKERRISCGIKQLAENPYEELRKRFRKGEILDCTVTGITDFGVFVDIGDGHEGLIHISRIPLDEGQKIEDLFHKGDRLQASLIKIDPDEKRIALSIKDVERRREREIISKYIKRDDSPSTSSLGDFMKNEEK